MQVRRFAAHSCGARGGGAALSPCGQWVAAGSDAQEVVLYDVRQSSVHSRLREVCVCCARR